VPQETLCLEATSAPPSPTVPGRVHRDRAEWGGGVGCRLIKSWFEKWGGFVRAWGIIAAREGTACDALFLRSTRPAHAVVCNSPVVRVAGVDVLGMGAEMRMLARTAQLEDELPADLWGMLWGGSTAGLEKNAHKLAQMRASASQQGIEEIAITHEHLQVRELAWPTTHATAGVWGITRCVSVSPN
jgi:hypothetical protein